MVRDRDEFAFDFPRTEENKELFLNELDLILPLDLIFTHEYENDRLKVIFKEVQ